MSVPEPIDAGTPTSATADIVAGFLAAAAIFAGIAALVYYPGRIGLAGIVIALIATGMGGGVKRLTAIGMAVAAAGFFFGMVISVLLDRPIF
jgi:hypothetical protein